MSINFKKISIIIIKFIVFYGCLSLIYETKIIKIDNEINETKYENNLNFTNFKTNHKIIAVFYPENNNYNSQFLKVEKEINVSFSIIEQQVKLAKNHGIFGFGVVYNPINESIFNDIIINYFSYFNELKFPFFIILNNDNHFCQNNFSLNYTYLDNILDKIKKYLSLDNYIKLSEKPIFGIMISKSITNDFITYMRKYEYENKIINIFINNGNQNFEYSDLINCSIKFPSINIGLIDELNQKYFYDYYYYNNLYKEDFENNREIKNFFIINGSNPKKFYIMFKTYLNQFLSDDDKIILFNAWNNYKDNFYLEPNKEYGFSYLNYFSKAIFNLVYMPEYSIDLFNNKSQIAVQVHLFYEDLIIDIINKTNNIPFKFDLYITIINDNIYNNLKNYIKNNSNSNKFEILIVENKGRDVLPFLTQMKKRFKKYKYICHIHSKKSTTVPEIGFVWRNYLFNNLLGNIHVVSEIINDFEQNRKLGFIFPETFYSILKQSFIISNATKFWVNYLSSKLFDNYERGKLLNFPAGNMFWAKIKAIFQIFLYDFSGDFPDEDNQINDTIMHGIERIWLYLVKFNHYKYKVIFNFF